MAQTTWMIARRTYAPMEYPLASWVELTAPQKTQDTRSGHEILDDMREELRKRVAAREAV